MSSEQRSQRPLYVALRLLLALMGQRAGTESYHAIVSANITLKHTSLHNSVARACPALSAVYV